MGSTLNIPRLNDEANTYQLNIRHHRLYLPEEFVRKWSETFVMIERITGLEGQVEALEGQEDLNQEMSDLRTRALPEVLRQCQRILLESQGRPTMKSITNLGVESRTRGIVESKICCHPRLLDLQREVVAGRCTFNTNRPVR